jgi:FlaA1/EpsC-like NDP-sugar epimerase
VRSKSPERTLIVGTGPLALTLLEEIASRPECQYRVIGVVDDTSGYPKQPFRELLVGTLVDFGSRRAII